MDLAARLRKHVRTIASTPHNAANPDQLESAALYIEGALAGIGYDVRRPSFRAGAQEVRNIEVVIEPKAPTTGRQLSYLAAVGSGQPGDFVPVNS
jgi:hypothetical protein